MINTLESEQFIQHYGVKGMKWGIRRYQPYPKGKGHKGRFIRNLNRRSSKDKGRTREERKRKAKKVLTVAAGITLAAGATYIVATKVGNKNLREYMKGVKSSPESIWNKSMSDLDGNDILLPKGTKLSRMSTSPKLSKTNMSYMSYEKDDINRYLSIYESINKDAIKGFYNIKMTADKPIKAMGERKQVETFSKLIKDEKFIKGLEDLKYSHSSINDRIRKIVDSSDSEQAAKSLFPMFSNALGTGTSNQAVKMFIDEIKKEGYNSMLDVNDRSLGIARNPIINLDPSNTVSQESSRKVNQIIKTMAKIKLK